MTTAGQVLGTPSYMSPEQVRGRNLDGRSDLFSFGVCMYEMLTGEKPFTGQNITTIIYKIMNEAPIPPRELDVSIHPGISAIITKTLEKNADERYQCGADLIKDLENYKSYGSSAPPTKVMSAAAAAEAAPSSGSRKIPAMPEDLESVTTSHIASEDVEEAVHAPVPQPVNVVSTGSTVRRAMPNVTAPPPPKRTKTALIVGVVMAFLLLGVGAAKMLRNKQAQAADGVQQQARQSTVPGAQSPAVEPSSTKPSAAIPASTTTAAKSAATKASGEGTTAEDTVHKTAVPATTGEARITSTPTGAKITIGGASQEKWLTPYTLTKLQPGKYDVTIAKAGYVSQTKEVAITAGRQSGMAFELVQAGATINVSSEPTGGMIFLDGKPTGKTTPSILNVDRGKHNIEVRKVGFGEENTNVNLTDGETYSFAPTLVSKNANAQQKAEQRERRGNFFSKIFGGGGQKIPAGKGLLVIRSSPAGATVMRNGKPTQGVTPLRVPMEPGNYSVSLHLDGYKNSQQTFNVTEGKSTELNVTLEKK
jgi:serine/threonine-protein kinase